MSCGLLLTAGSLGIKPGWTPSAPSRRLGSCLSDSRVRLSRCSAWGLTSKSCCVCHNCAMPIWKLYNNLLSLDSLTPPKWDQAFALFSVAIKVRNTQLQYRKTHCELTQASRKDVGVLVLITCSTPQSARGQTGRERVSQLSSTN